MYAETDHWIVRCAPAKTLGALSTLHEHGFTAWTPTTTQRYRKARSKKYIKVTVAMMPSFVFVQRGADPLSCAVSIDSVDGVRVWKQDGCYKAVRDAALDALRDVEREAADEGLDNLVHSDPFFIGQIGTVQSPVLEGLTCKLVGRVKADLLVTVEGSDLPIKIKSISFVPITK